MNKRQRPNHRPTSKTAPCLVHLPFPLSFFLLSSNRDRSFVLEREEEEEEEEEEEASFDHPEMHGDG